MRGKVQTRRHQDRAQSHGDGRSASEPSGFQNGAEEERQPERGTRAEESSGDARLERVVWFSWIGLAAALGLTLVIFALEHAPARRQSPPPVPRTAPGAQPRPVALPQASLTINRGAAVTTVPRSFLGVSTEYWTLPIWEHHLPLVEKLLSLMRAPGDGPLVLRIGGDSADHAYWENGRYDTPEWAYELTPAWLQEAGTLVRQTGARLILDLNLVTATPEIAAEWAQAARAELPARSIVGFEIGNEPDTYSRQAWLAMLGIGPAVGILPASISAAGYAQDFLSYARALSRVAPGTPLLGPAVAHPLLSLPWISKLLAGRHPGLAEITAHEYPYTACAGIGSPAYPTIARILSDRASAGMARALRPAVALAHAAGLPFRLTEINSVTCGGRAGVSETFATALWAPDALFELLRAGVDAVNVHIRADTINAAFVLTNHGVLARPLLYGLIMFARTLGRDPKLLQVHLRARSSLQLKAWAVSVGRNALHVLLIDKGNHPVTVLLHLPGDGTATIQRLLAPSAAARSGATIDGQQLDGAGNWRGAPNIEKLSPGPHGYQVTVRQQSAALVSVLHAGPLARTNIHSSRT